MCPAGQAQAALGRLLQANLSGDQWRRLRSAPVPERIHAGAARCAADPCAAPARAHRRIRARRWIRTAAWTRPGPVASRRVRGARYIMCARGCARTSIARGRVGGVRPGRGLACGPPCESEAMKARLWTPAMKARLWTPALKARLWVPFAVEWLSVAPRSLARMAEWNGAPPPSGRGSARERWGSGEAWRHRAFAFARIIRSLIFDAAIEEKTLIARWADFRRVRAGTTPLNP